MKQIKYSAVLASVLIPALFLLDGCQAKKGSGEKAGERVDEIIDNVKDGDAPLHKKGAGEKLGESIDDTVKDLKKQNNDASR